MADQPDEIVITLRSAVTFGDEAWTELKLREPTAAEWQQWDKLAGVEADIMAVSVVSGVPLNVVKQIGARDLIAAAKFIAGFLS